MVGVIIVTLGLPALFASIAEGDHVDNGVVVTGYVIMRVALVGLWLRPARDDPVRRTTCMAYAGFVSVAQLGWIAVAIGQLGLLPTALLSLALDALELIGPYLAEIRVGRTPWHAHHIAERYGLFTIIALGESLFGTVTVVSASIHTRGWTPDAAVIAAAGVGLTFGLWWAYFILPSAPVLRRYRRRAFLWGYAHILVISFVAATGAGLHVVAYAIDGDFAASTATTVA